MVACKPVLFAITEFVALLYDVAETAKLSKGDFAKRHCNTETVDSNTDQTSACSCLNLLENQPKI